MTAARDSAPEGLEESAEDLYEQAPCGYLTLLPDGTVARVNATFLAWTGYAREALVGARRLQALLSVGGRIYFETHVAPLLQMQGAVSELALEVLRADGQPMPVLLNASVQRGPDGRSRYTRVTVFNATERRRYEQELVRERARAEAAARAKADFLSLVSHEIRTPLNALMGVTSLLQRTALSPQQRKYVRILQSSSENLLGLLNNVLDFGKAEAGKAVLEERPFELRQVVFSSVYGLMVKAEEKHLLLDVQVDPAVPAFLLGDPVKLGQVLTNLVSNAVKFTAQGSVVVAVEAREVRDGVATLGFRVSDTGIGIPVEAQAHLFEAFTQASYDVGMRYGGTGLGLAICRKLLELHGSRMHLESREGEGATFHFELRLRVADAAPEADAGPDPALAAEALRGLRVLVAEDNAVNIFMLVQHLRRWGVEFDVVEDGRQAVERVRAGRYDLVLMDLRMPELDGYAATRAIRALPGERFGRLPIIAVTASGRPGLEARADEAGLTDVLPKPFRPEELFEKLALHGARPLSVPTAVLAPDAGAPAGFSLEKLRRLTETDRTGRVALLNLTVAAFEKFKQDFRRALEERSLEEFRYQEGRLEVSAELLEAEGLRRAVQEGRAALETATPGAGLSPRLTEAGHGILRELDAVLAALREELRSA